MVGEGGRRRWWEWVREGGIGWEKLVGEGDGRRWWEKVVGEDRRGGVGCERVIRAGGRVGGRG